MEFLQAKLLVEDPQARCLSNLEVATKHVVRTERPLFNRRADSIRKIIHHGPSGPGIVDQICSPLMKAVPPRLHCR
jgi:hypothetical protein